jgi:hypothetical protein
VPGAVWHADDNTFDGCHFFNNSFGIICGEMANVCELIVLFGRNFPSSLTKSAR